MIRSQLTLEVLCSNSDFNELIKLSFAKNLVIDYNRLKVKVRHCAV